MLYPDATLWAAPGLSRKRKDINFDAILTEKNPEWGNSIEFQLIAGVPLLNEVVFFHSPSRSLICSDILFNIHEGTNFLVRAAWKLFGVWKRFGQDRFWRFMVKDKEMVTKSINSMLSWKFERVIMAHGDITACDRYQLYEILKEKNKDIVLV